MTEYLWCLSKWRTTSKKQKHNFCSMQQTSFSEGNLNTVWQNWKIIFLQKHVNYYGRVGFWKSVALFPQVKTYYLHSIGSPIVSSLKSRYRGLIAVIYFHHKHSVFCRWQTLFSGQKCDDLVGRAEDRHSMYSCGIFFPHISCQRVTVMTLLLFGHVTLLCGKFLFIKLSEGPVQLSDYTINPPSIREDGLSIHTGSVHQ